MVRDAGVRGEELAWEIKMARTYLPLREVVKFHYLKGYDTLRQLAVLIARKVKCEPGLIFWLCPEEIFTLDTSNAKALLLTAIGRRALYGLYGEIHVPAVFAANELQRIGRLPARGVGAALRGIGVTNVVSEGKVVIVHDLNDKETISRLCPGSILVTSTTDPAWSPVLSVVGSHGGLVTEIGGLLAHGAIYAREMGIAAVLNIPNVTNILKTGMRVKVDSKRGLVTILP